MRKLRKTTESFVKEAIEKFGNFYNYEFVEYLGCSKPVRIICPIHGEFEQKPASHLFGMGCKLCGKDKSLKGRTSTTKEFTEKANKKHNNFFTYSKVNYVNAITHVVVSCPVHGDFSILPNSHLSGTGCKSCYKDRNGFGRESFVKSCKNGTGYLYLIKCWSATENFYKIGITGKTVKERFKNYSKFPYKYKIEFILEDKPYKVFNLEKKLHKKFSKYKYRPLKRFKGETECFTLNDKITLYDI